MARESRAQLETLLFDIRVAAWSLLELETKVREGFTITEKSPARFLKWHVSVIVKSLLTIV